MIVVIVKSSFHDHMDTIRELIMHTNLYYHGVRKKNNKIRLTLKNGASKIVFVYNSLIRIREESPPPISMYS